MALKESVVGAYNLPHPDNLICIIEGKFPLILPIILRILAEGGLTTREAVESLSDPEMPI